MSRKSLYDLCRSRLNKYSSSRFAEAYRLVEPSEHQKAAVLIPVFVKEGQLHVLLTLRSKNLSTHKGQVAFPGGKQDRTDKDIIATALRETHEEVGIPPEMVEVISVWHPTYSRAGLKPLLVYPVIGLLKPGFNVVANAAEVERVFDTPLGFFLSGKSHMYRPSDETENTYYLHFFTYTYPSDDYQAGVPFLIWGLTANLCIRLAVILLEALPVGFEFKDPRETKGLKNYVEWLQKQAEFGKASRL